MRHLFSIIIIAAIVASAAARTADGLMDAGNSAFAKADYRLAASWFHKADSVFRAEGQDSTADHAQCLHNLGRCYSSMGDYIKGRDYTSQAAALREKLSGRLSEPYITSLNNIALSYYSELNYDRALQLQKEVIRLCDSLPSRHKDEGMYRTNLGRYYIALGLKDQAAEEMERALPLVEKFGDVYEFLLYYLGEIYQGTGNVKNLDRIMTLADEHNRHELTKACDEPKCMLQRAEYYQDQNDFANAREAYIQLLAMDMTDDEKVLAYIKYAGFLSGSLRDFSQAADYYLMASQVAEKSGMNSDNVILFLIQNARCHFIAEDYERAISSATQSYERTLSANNTKRRKDALEVIGNARKATKSYDSASKAYSELLEMMEKDGEAYSARYAKILYSLATAEKFGKNYDQAITHYRRAIDIYTALNMPNELQSTADALRTCLAYAGYAPDETLYDDSKAFAAKVERILKEELANLPMIKNHLGKLDHAGSLATIAGCYAMLDDYDNSVDYYASYAKELRQGLLDVFRLSGAHERANLWHHQSSTLSELSELLAVIPDPMPIKSKCAATMFDIQLLRKGLLLTSAIEFEKLLERRNDPALIDRYNKIKSLSEEIAEERANATTSDETARVAGKQTELDRMMLELYKACAEAGDYTNYLRYDIDDVRKALPYNAVAVEFVILDDMILRDDCHAAALVMRKDSPEIATVMLPTVKELRQMADATDLTVNDSYGHAIWDSILQPGDIRQIYFSPDGPLHQIPLEYLSINGKTMADSYDMIRVTSTKELCRKHRPFAVETLALFGDIDYDAETTDSETTKPKNEPAVITATQKRQSAGPNLALLPGTRIEVTAIDSLYRRNIRPQLFTGPNATKEAFLNIQSEHPDILHISTHGKYEPHKGITEDQSMLNSVLAFAGANNYDDISENPAMANAAEVAGMNLSGCRLTVLSACESGLGKAGDDGIFGLQRGFKNAGVESLIVTLQSVNDLMAAELMISFYRHLHGGKSPSQALQAAREEARKANPADTTWASFILIDGF